MFESLYDRSMDSLGYCCINTELRERGIFCSRSMIKRTFSLSRASELALENVKDLLRILKWNELHDIRVFRISSEILPRYTCKTHRYSFTDLKDHEEISSILGECGSYVKQHNHEISFHPGPFTVLASPNKESVNNSILELEYHSMLCDMLDPHDELDIPINIHVGGSYNKTYEETANRFIEVYRGLSSNIRSRLVIENDDKGNCWSVKKLYDYLYLKIGIPITLDIHHWYFCHEEDRTLEEDYKLSRSTWGTRSQQIHYSESKDENKMVPAHSYIYVNKLPSFLEGKYHVHLECKGKEQGLYALRDLG